jgi:peptidoglycan/LPS O-acetylase OafA/YrhL
MALLEVLGVSLWALLGLLGAWMLVTGRKLVGDLPKGIREGWPLRVFGFFYVAVAAVLMTMALRGSLFADGIIMGYVSFGLALAYLLNRWRKDREDSGGAPAAR